jgi:hypothetical protein
LSFSTEHRDLFHPSLKRPLDWSHLAMSSDAV